jgi:hypothetical protein
MTDERTPRRERPRSGIRATRPRRHCLEAEGLGLSFRPLARSAREGDRPSNFAKWHALQRWILAGECQVVVPFAVELGKLIPPIAVWLRRDFTLLLSLIKAHALLHPQDPASIDSGSQQSAQRWRVNAPACVWLQ